MDAADLRDAMARLAAEDLDEVLAQARADARSRAARALADALTEELLAQAAAPPPRRATGEQGWYVYAVVRGEPADLPAGLQAIGEGGLVAVARRVPLDEYGEEALRANLNDIAWLEEAARRHEAVLDTLLRATTVIPMRLCTIYRSQEAVRDMLAAEQAAFGAALDRLAGHTEWGAKAFCDRAALAAGVAAAESGGGEGEAYLARRRGEAQARGRADAWVEAAHARLAEAAREALVNPLQRRELTGREDDMVLNGVYLVADGCSEAFSDTVRALAEDAPVGLTLELTGPWPPYNFVGRSVEAAR